MNETPAAFFRIQPLDEFRALSSDSPVAFTALAGAAQMTAKGQKGGCRYIAGICAEGDGFNDIGRASDASADDQGNLIPDAFIPQALVYPRYPGCVSAQRRCRRGSRR